MYYWALLIFLPPLLLAPVELWARKHRGTSSLPAFRQLAILLLLVSLGPHVTRVVRAWPTWQHQPTLALDSVLSSLLSIPLVLLLLYALLRPRHRPLPTPRQFERNPPVLLLSLFLCLLIGSTMGNEAARAIANIVASHLGWERPEYMMRSLDWLPRELNPEILLMAAAFVTGAILSGIMVLQRHRELLRGETYKSPLVPLFLVMFASELMPSVILSNAALVELPFSAFFWTAIAVHHYLLLYTLHWEEPYYLTAADFAPSGQLATQFQH